VFDSWAEEKAGLNSWGPGTCHDLPRVERRVTKDAVDPGAWGSLQARLARWPAGVVRWRWPIVVIWAIAAAIFVPAARKLEDRLEVAAHMPGGQAQAVENDLQLRFRSPFTNRVILVAEGLPPFRHPRRPHPPHP